MDAQGNRLSVAIEENRAKKIYITTPDGAELCCTLTKLEAESAAVLLRHYLGR